jgi:hypothetical protein
MVAVVAVAYFAVIIVALHVLRPDLNPLSRPTSEYAVGAYGLLMSTAFFSMSVATFALVIGLARGLSHAARSRVGLGLLSLWGIGVLIAMIFPIDAEGASPTLAGTIHGINGPIAFLCMTAGVFLVSRRFKWDHHWRPLYRTALMLALLLLGGLVATPLSLAMQSGLAGLAQRVSLVALVTWMLLTAVRLRAVSSRYTLD